MAATATGVGKLNVHSRATFVKSNVGETAVTTKIIDAILPYFPQDCKVIAGYLDDYQQYWKVNYHWELLMSKIDALLTKDAVADNLKECARAIRKALTPNPPSPADGYLDDKKPGDTKDASTPKQIITRHGILRQAKKDFDSVLVKSGIVDAKKRANPPAKDKMWWLAVAPVAKPGTSKHGSGYALDIAGDNAKTTKISHALGASLVFNEASHVHVEWRNGVKIPT